MLSLSNSRPEPAVQARTKWCAKNKQGTPAQSRQASAASPLPARKEKKRKEKRREKRKENKRLRRNRRRRQFNEKPSVILGCPDPLPATYLAMLLLSISWSQGCYWLSHLQPCLSTVL